MIIVRRFFLVVLILIFMAEALEPTYYKADPDSYRQAKISEISDLILTADSSIENPDTIASAVYDITQDCGVDRRLVLAVIIQESHFDPQAVGGSGERGLMQIMPSTAYQLAEDLGWGDFSSDDLFDIETNIRLGVYYLMVCKARVSYFFDSMDVIRELSLTAYNRGISVVIKKLGEHSNPRNGYEKQVLSRRENILLGNFQLAVD